MSYYPLYYQIDSGLNLAKAPVIMTSSSGSVASFPDGAADLPLHRLTADINPVQDLHGYDAPWPAGSKPQLFNQENFTSNRFVNVVAGVIGISGNWGITGEIPVLPNTNYCISNDTKMNSTNAGLAFYDADHVFISSWRYDEEYFIEDTTLNRWYYSLTSPEGAAFVNCSVSKNDERKFQIEEGTTPTAYSTYSNICPISGWNGVNVVISPTTDAEDGTTFPIAFPAEVGTVYGGTLSINEDGTAELVVDRSIITYSDATGFSLHSSDRWYKESLPDNFNQAKSDQAISNIAKNQSSAFSYGPYFTFGTAGIYVNKLNSDETIEEFDERLQETPMVVCYFLATPITYSLSAPQVRTLLGINNIWADTGDTTATYRADTKLYIEQLTKPDEYDMIADDNIASGKFFMVGNRLYLSTAAIEQGAAIVPGTNCTEMSLADALNSINT